MCICFYNFVEVNIKMYLFYMLDIFYKICLFKVNIICFFEILVMQKSDEKRKYSYNYSVIKIYFVKIDV